MNQKVHKNWLDPVLFLLAIIAVIAIVILGTGCVSDAESARVQARKDIASVLRVAYEVGGSAAVAQRIDGLVAEGKLTEAQGNALKAFADEACEEMLRRLSGEDSSLTATGSATNSTECVDCGSCGDCGSPDGCEDDGCEDDANCGNCDVCRESGEEGCGGGDAANDGCSGCEVK